MRMIKETIIQLAPHYVVTHWTWLDFDQKAVVRLGHVL